MNLEAHSHALFRHIMEVSTWAEAQSIECKRKVVGCSIVTLSHMLPISDWSSFDVKDGLVEFVRSTNGPTPGYTCTGEKGNCGCAHAEPRAVLSMMNMLNRQAKTILCCNYSPCTRCAQMIIDANSIAGLIDAVVYIKLTEHDVRGRDLLILAGLTVMQVNDQMATGIKSQFNSAVCCEHANECPAVCPCGPDCYCRSHTCKLTVRVK